MKGNHASGLEPDANFLVEREPGQGYRVTSADGSCANEWKDRALALLDDLGQPNPKGPEESFRWLGPVAPSGEYVGVSVKLMPNGEARYYQAWFRLPKSASCSRLSLGLLLLLVLVGLVVGGVVGRTLLPADRGTSSRPKPPTEGSIDSGKVNSRANRPEPDARVTKLNAELVSSLEMRAKLREYLSQEGLAADTSLPVIDERRSIKLIADLDKTPPLHESIRLSNVEVARLLGLLRTLEAWTAGPMQEMPERHDHDFKNSNPRNVP